jgi:hypothetical protein
MIATADKRSPITAHWLAHSEAPSLGTDIVEAPTGA